MVKMLALEAGVRESCTVRLSSQRAAACQRETLVSACEPTTKEPSPRSDDSPNSRGSTPKRPSNLLVFADASLVVSQFALYTGQGFEEEARSPASARLP